MKVTFIESVTNNALNNTKQVQIDLKFDAAVDQQRFCPNCCTSVLIWHRGGAQPGLGDRESYVLPCKALE